METDTSKDSEGFVEETYVENWFRQLNMPKVTRTIVHVSSARLAPSESIDNTLTWVHDTIVLWFTIFCHLVFQKFPYYLESNSERKIYFVCFYAKNRMLLVGYCRKQ